MTRTYGSNYDGNRTVKEDAAAIRKSLRFATRGTGPLAGWTVSVRYRTASMMQAIDVELTPPAGTHTRHQFNYLFDDRPCELCGAQPASGTYFTDLGATVNDIATTLWESYNHDGSDPQTDYFDSKYYGTIIINDTTKAAA